MTLEEFSYNNPVINLIEMCHKNPQEANNLVKNASSFPDIYKHNLEGIPYAIYCSKPPNCTNINNIVCIRGSVIKVYEILFKNVKNAVQCLKCNELSESHDSSKKRTASICEACGSSSIQQLQNFQSAISSQFIRIQDIGNPRSMSETTEILLEGDKAGQFVPGDKVTITGVVFRKWKPVRMNEPMLSSICVKALKIVKENSDKSIYFEIKNQVDEYMLKNDFEKRSLILESFASEIFGCNNVKLGLILGLIGGSGDGREISKARGNIHILMVGDPGTGKSHLLKTAASLIAPAIITNGVGTSDAGLTSCAVRHGKEWALEAGALVLADLGVCCIDEFNRLKINEKSGLLESMEQQTLSVAKAGIVTSLNTRCSVFASSGTRYNYDLRKPVSDNLGLTTPLVSRFDLIFGMFNIENYEADKSKVLKVLERSNIISKAKDSEKWSHGVLKLFIAECRKKKNRIDEKLSKILLAYYIKKRHIDGRNEFNTIRMLESLIRISEASSKLLGRDEVVEDDVYVAMILNETGLNVSSKINIDVENVFIKEDLFNKTKEKLRITYSLDKSEDA